MTPQEKAYDIVRKIGSATLFTRFNGGNTIEKEEAKLYALIAVDEIQKAEGNVLIKFGFVTKNYKSDYWQEVKQEIEKL